MLTDGVIAGVVLMVTLLLISLWQEEVALVADTV